MLNHLVFILLLILIYVKKTFFNLFFFIHFFNDILEFLKYFFSKFNLRLSKKMKFPEILLKIIVVNY